MTQESSLILSMRRIHDLVIQRANDNLKAYDLTISQVLLMSYCLSHEGEAVYQRDMERYFGLSHVTVIGLLKRLSDNQYVRIQVSETDRRQRMVFLTERAHSIAEDIKRQVHWFEAMLTDTLSQEELQVMQKCLNVIYHNLISQDENQKGSQS